jgi:hypothetical protein
MAGLTYAKGREETENPPPFRVGEMRIFSFRGVGERTGGGKESTGGSS